LIVYASLGGAGIFKSATSGSSWAPINVGLPDPSTVFTTGLVVDPQTPSILYAAIPNAGVYKSTNGGTSWGQINNGLSNLSVQALAIDPRAPGTLYVGTGDKGIFRTTDAGANWSLFTSGLNSEESLRIQDLAVAPGPTANVYAATFGGIFVLQDPTLCNPRPKVSVSTTRTGSGQLQATIAAQTSSGTPTNSLQSITVTRIDGAVVQVNGSPIATGATITFPGGTSQATLLIERQAPGAASHVGFSVTDACGEWKSFVGGGPGAF
jgi:hypothetical protein